MVLASGTRLVPHAITSQTGEGAVGEADNE